MTTKMAAVITALVAVLDAIPGVTVVANVAVPQEIPEGGLIIVHDGDPGEPEEVLNGFRNCYYQHSIDVEIYARHGITGNRDSAWDTLIAAVGTALEGNLTLSGTIHGMSYGQPTTDVEQVEGGHDIKRGVLIIIADYQSSSPLG